MTAREMDLPEGPVTIMFTDIVGSTALRTTLGDTQADELFRLHDDLLRSAIEEHRGRDQKAALGDGFLAVFFSTRRALAAAVAIQRALDAFNHARSGPPLTVRLGLNTGEVTWQDGHLSGESVHAASRVCAAAKGGQILASDVTRQLAGTVPDLSFVDAGEHDLKGFPQPWRLWEVAWVRPTPQGREEVFVERAKELAVLRSHLTEALDGRGSLVLVGGEPGVGKTTLVRQLIRDAEARGALALFGRCYEFEGALPYSPFIEMLEHALSVMPPELVREDMGDDAAEVARMVPELRRRFPDIPAPLDLPPEQQRRYFFNAVEAFLRRAAARFPLMLVLDDVHWADVPTLLLIEHMARVMPENRVLGVGTYRDVELDVSRPLVATLDRLVRARAVDRISLSRLDVGGVARMIEALAGREAPQQVVSVVYDETEGNPFFVMEVFRHLAEEGRLFDAAGAFRDDLSVDELDVPESVRLVVGRRLERLGPEAQRALAAGAVVGRGFPFALLEEISDVPTPQLVDIVEEAEAARVVVPEERGGAIHYTFAHELIRQTLLTSLSLLRRQRLHLAVADAMERLFPDARDTRSSELAHHLLQAGAAADPARTLSYLERSADRAVASAAFEDALRAIADALTLVPPDDERRRVHLRLRQGLAVRALGHYDECLVIWDEVVDGLAALGEREEAATLCWAMGYQLIWLNRFEEAFLTYDRGRQILGDTGGPARAALIGSQGVLAGLAGLHGVYEASVTLLDEAEGIARDLENDREIARASWGRCVVDWAFLRLPEAERSGRRAVEHARASGDQWLVADSLAWLSFPLGSSGSLDECTVVAQEGVDVAQRIGHIAAEIVARRGVILAGAARDPDLDVIEAGLEKDLQLCLSIGSPWRSQALGWLGFIATMRGRLDEGLQRAEEAQAVEPVSAWSGFAWSSRLYNRTAAGEVGLVREMLADRAADIRTVDGSSTMGGFLSLSVATEAAARIGDGELCAELYPLLAAQLGRCLMRPFDWSIEDRVLGMAAATAGLWEQAEEHFEQALVRATKVPVLLDEPIVRHRYGEALLTRGRPQDAGRAKALVAEAVDGYRRLGMRLLLAEAEQLLRA
jgi:class 3 adenylate cyclase/tetratricopeptide (TPR) repeat protein